ncbi:MAG: peptide deformylase [Nitrospirae bacterium]|nr:MAG: peptide deformylase [Nitrospirota bacterium]
MAILKTAKMGHPILRAGTERVDPAAIASRRFQRLIDDMIETLRDADGAGLAAPQVHEPVRLVVIEVRHNRRYPEAPTLPLTVLVNPEVTPLTDEKVAGWEGCLSIPELRGLVPRFRAVEVAALDRDGEPVRFCAEGFFATVIQHEVDHLHGVLFPDRMEDLRTLSFLSEWERYWRTPAPTPCS